MKRRFATVALTALLVVADPLGLRPPALAAPEVAPSVGNAVLFHLQLATDLATDGSPIGQGTVFPEGTEVIFGLLGWSYVPAGTELKLRLFQADRTLKSSRIDPDIQITRLVRALADDAAGPR
jgi:hypothetical protein